MATIISYNVNGIRSAINKGWFDWLKTVDPDIVLLQEIKAEAVQLDLAAFEAAGYVHHYWHSAQKKGYSGVAILCKQKPDHVEVGCGNALYDNEGRILRADFGDVSVMSVYMPSGTSGDERQQFKYGFLDFFQTYIDQLKKKRKKLVIGGDWNICHQPIDIHNPVSNAKSSGFLPEERAWIDRFIKAGFIDSFRRYNTEPHHYTWWSQRFKARDRNLGWRIDYHMVSASLEKQLRHAAILADARHSDHCPILIDLNLS